MSNGLLHPYSSSRIASSSHSSFSHLRSLFSPLFCDISGSIIVRSYDIIQHSRTYTPKILQAAKPTAKLQDSARLPFFCLPYSVTGMLLRTAPQQLQTRLKIQGMRRKTS
ncbi:hypothetical protein OCU04_005247 [Sclerotinia nivalis]|uniref:Uncharacterized protein n=1 Tax=Sclerotinia nivalis TaxID=352851 RepID=A0A9X0ANT9_9HELO|nr:hypothetical protein OCU04_005247 [Sclerotinia nivalis]